MMDRDAPLFPEPKLDASLSGSAGLHRRVLKRLKQVHGLWPGYIGGTWTLRFDEGPRFAHEAIGALEAAEVHLFDAAQQARLATLLRALIEAEAKRAGA